MYNTDTPWRKEPSFQKGKRVRQEWIWRRKTIQNKNDSHREDIRGGWLKKKRRLTVFQIELTVQVKQKFRKRKDWDQLLNLTSYGGNNPSETTPSKKLKQD